MDFEKQWKSVTRENRKIEPSSDRRIWNGIEKKIRVKKYIRTSFAVAAMIIPFMAIMGLYLFENGNSSYSVQKELVFKSSGSRQVFMLSDGSKVTLEPQSELILDEGFGGENRGVSFKGKAFFSVAKNKELPFVVDAGGFKVQVLGTQFTLDQRENNKVYLKEGKVKINYKGRSTFLLPKETWLADKNGVEKHFYDNDVERNFDFNDLRFDEAVSQLEKTYNVSIEYPREYKDNIIAGDISGDLEKVLRTISFPFNLNIEKKTHEHIILKK